MKTVIQSIILASLLSGCYQMINQKDLARAATFCQNKEGVYSIMITFDGDEVVTCKNGERSRLPNG